MEFFCLLVLLAGSSDPYVKFEMAGRDVFRSRTVRKNLNPVWNHKTTLVTHNLGEPLHVKVCTHISYDATLLQMITIVW